MPDLISRLSEAEEADLEDLARLTTTHYQKLIASGLPEAHAATLVRDLHSAWLAAIYSEAALQRDRLLAAVVGHQPALKDGELAIGKMPALFQARETL